MCEKREGEEEIVWRTDDVDEYKERGEEGVGREGGRASLRSTKLPHCLDSLFLWQNAFIASRALSSSSMSIAR